MKPLNQNAKSASKTPAKPTAAQKAKEAEQKKKLQLAKKSKNISGKKDKTRRPKLKKWLETAEDWARFNAWAEVKAKPRQLPELEPIVRPTKPLNLLKKRLKILCVPRKAPNLSENCREDQSISKAALKAVASRRLIQLSWPVIRIPDAGNDLPPKIPVAVLRYEATPRIIEISQPRVFIREECRPFQVSEQALRHETTDRETQLALHKKLVECPEFLTKEEREELFTPDGTRKSALTYEFKSWMNLLSLPAYKRIRDRKDEKAKIWKKTLIEEPEVRGKRALSEQRKKRKRKLEEKEDKERKKLKVSDKEDDDEQETMEDGEVGKNKREEVRNKEKGTQDDEKNDKKAQKRKKKKNAWRFELLPYKENPYRIREAALSYEATPRISELAKARKPKRSVVKKNAFRVKRKALKATASARVKVLATPKNPANPIEKKPPREKDQFGAPIFPKRVYRKVLPKTKPYKERDCPPTKPEEKQEEKERPINRIVYEPTVDPCVNPRLAKFQMRERKRAREKREKEKALKGKEDRVPPTETQNNDTAE